MSGLRNEEIHLDVTRELDMDLPKHATVVEPAGSVVQPWSQRAQQLGREPERLPRPRPGRMGVDPAELDEIGGRIYGR